MRRRTTAILCILLAVLFSAFALAACNAGGGAPEIPDGGVNTPPGGEQGGDTDNNGGGEVNKDNYTLSLANRNISISLAKNASQTAEIGITVKKNGEAFSGAVITCKSLNESVATVTSGGTVTGVSDGNTQISVRAEADGANPISGLVNVSVFTPETSVSLVSSSKSVESADKIWLDDFWNADGEVYELSGYTKLTPTNRSASKGMDKRFAEGYRYLSFDIMFAEEVAKEIEVRCGSTKTFYRNADERKCVIANNNASVSEAGFVIYDENKNLVFDKCYLETQNAEIGGVADGKMEAGRWYSVVIPLGNKTKAMHSGGFAILFNGDCSVKNFDMYKYDPYASEKARSGDLYEVYCDERPYGDGGAYWLNRLYWGTPEWGDTETYYCVQAEQLQGSDGTYNLSGYEFAQPAAQESEPFGGAHFLTLDNVTEKMAQGATLVRFNANFSALQSFTAGHSEHNLESPFNMFVYANDKYSYLTFNNEYESGETTAHGALLQNGVGITVYDAETKAVILNGWNGAVQAAEVMTAGKTYTFEINLMAGSRKNNIMLCGLDGATVSDITWSAKRYGENAEWAVLRALNYTPEKDRDYIKEMSVQTTVGTADAMASAYASGYKYVAVPVTLGSAVPNGFTVSVYGEAYTVDSENFGGEVVKCYDAEQDKWTEVGSFSALTAGKQYVFVMDLSAAIPQDETPDFTGKTVVMQFGFNDCTIGDALMLNDDYPKLST